MPLTCNTCSMLADVGHIPYWLKCNQHTQDAESDARLGQCTQWSSTNTSFRHTQRANIAQHLRLHRQTSMRCTMLSWCTLSKILISRSAVSGNCWEQQNERPTSIEVSPFSNASYTHQSFQQQMTRWTSVTPHHIRLVCVYASAKPTASGWFGNYRWESGVDCSLFFSTEGSFNDHHPETGHARPDKYTLKLPSAVSITRNLCRRTLVAVTDSPKQPEMIKQEKCVYYMRQMRRLRQAGELQIPLTYPFFFIVHKHLLQSN